MKGRLAPVLPQLIEPVRGCADAAPANHHSRVGPRVGAARVRPDGEVVDDARAHTGLGRRLLGRGELLLGHPLQPLVETGGRAVLPLREHGFYATDIAQRLWPAPPVGPV